MFLLKDRKGFTLLELMLTLSIFGIIMTFMFQIMNSNIRLVKREDIRAEHAENARSAAINIMKKVREADMAGVEYDSATREIKAANGVVLNAAANLSNPGNAALWYSRPAGSEYGELRDKSGNVLASYIRQLDIDSSNSAYLRLTIATGRDEPGNYPLYLCIPLRSQTAPGAPGIKVMMYNANYQNPNDNVIKPMLKIVNTGTGPLNLADVKIRYYYTIDGERDQTFECFWASVAGGSSNVTGKFIRMGSPTLNADYYLEIGFLPGVGILEPGMMVELHTMISNKVYNLPYLQNNDYSFNPYASTFVDWPKVTAYINNSLRWGVEPSGPGPSNLKLRIQMYNVDRQDSTSSISPWFRIINDGDMYINLQDLKIRYYFNIDQEKPLNFWCDWADQYFIGGNANVTGTFIKMTAPGVGANYYLEIGFKSMAGSLPPGMSADIHVRFAKNDWSLNTQTDDYSFNKTSADFIDWKRVTGHIGANLVWGTPPSPLPPDAVVYYEFAGNTFDLSGNGNDGIVCPTDKKDRATPVFVTGHDGQPGSALCFNGDYYIEAPSSSSLRSVDDEVTIDLWCYPTASENKMNIVDWTKGKHGFELYINEDGELVFETKGVSVVTPQAIPLNRWTHVKATYKSNTTNGIRIYLDDIIVAQKDTKNKVISDDSQGLVIGAGRKGNSDNVSTGFIGYLDNILIRNSVDY